MFESELKYIYDIKRLNSMNYISYNKVNNINEYNLIHDILNPSKRTNIYIFPLFPSSTSMYEYAEG